VSSFVVVKWNPEGCFNEHKRSAKRVLKHKFATIKGISTENADIIEKVFNKCREKAEEEDYNIFAIRVRRNLELFFFFSRWQGGILIGFLSGLYFAKRLELGEKAAKYFLSFLFPIGEY